MSLTVKGKTADEVLELLNPPPLTEAELLIYLQDKMGYTLSRATEALA